MLTIDKLEKLRLEFPEVFSELFNGVYQRLQKDLILKVDNIKKEEQKHFKPLDLRQRFTGMLSGSFKSDINESKSPGSKNSNSGPPSSSFLMPP